MSRSTQLRSGQTPGSAANIANLVAFLAGQDGHSINGQVIRPNGEIA
jgi:hypothetical protein